MGRQGGHYGYYDHNPVFDADDFDESILDDDDFWEDDEEDDEEFEEFLNDLYEEDA